MWVQSLASAQSFLLQSVLTVYVLVFSVNRAWRFDHCRSILFWRTGRSREQQLFYSFMLWSYMLGLISDAFEGVAMAVIRFQLVIHQEESIYWLRLVTLKPTSPGWFQSRYFKAVVISCLLIVILMFGSLVALINRPFRLGAILVTIFGIITALQNCVFTFYVNARFPRFLDDLQARGARIELLNRFSEFDRLNRLRVATRWVLAAATCTLGLDAFTAAKNVNRTPWAVDLLVLCALSSFAISSCLTLVIFLPLQDKFNLLDTNPTLRDFNSTAWVPPPPVEPIVIDTVPASPSQKSSSGHGGPVHPFAAPVTIRLRRVTDDSAGPISRSLHPDVLGYASPIDIGTWREGVETVDVVPLQV